nr:tetratricopeptide repeat protein [Chryseosolibacter indicus]
MDGENQEFYIVLNNIGFVYYKLKEYNKALSYYLQSLDLQNRLQEYYDFESDLLNVSLCYINLKDFGRAKEYVDSALNSCKTHCSDDVILNGYYSLGEIFLNLKDSAKAEYQFVKSLKTAKDLGNHRLVLDNIVQLSHILISQGRMSEAKTYLEEAEVLINNSASFNLEIIKIYSCLVAFYKKLGDFIQMAYYQEKYISIKDSIYNEALTTNLMKVEAEHLQKENMARIEAQKQVIDLTEKNITVQRWVNILIGVIAFALLIVIMLLIRINKTRKTINEALEKKVQERTKELQQSRDSWHKAYEVKEQLIAKATTEIKSSIATLKGLSTLGLKQFKEPDAIQYIKEVELTSGNLMSVIEVFNNKEFTQQA